MSADTAILCCIPLEEAEWLERSANPELGDFVRSNAEEKGNGNLQLTWRLFSREAAFIQRKLDALARRQVAVVVRAGTSHIRDAAARCREVVVVAHWKHERVLSSDILSPRLLWQHLIGIDPGLQRLASAEGEGRQFGDFLRSALDSLIVHGGSSLVAVSEGAGGGRLPASVLRREALNALPYLAAGNRVETWDSMLSAEAFCELFGTGFEGTAVLAVCNSVLLAETFRARHPNAICIANKNTANAGLNLAKLDAAVTLMRTGQIPLWRALQEVGEIVDFLAT